MSQIAPSPWASRLPTASTLGQWGSALTKNTLVTPMTVGRSSSLSARVTKCGDAFAGGSRGCREVIPMMVGGPHRCARAGITAQGGELVIGVLHALSTGMNAQQCISQRDKQLTSEKTYAGGDGECRRTTRNWRRETESKAGKGQGCCTTGRHHTDGLGWASKGQDKP